VNLLAVLSVVATGDYPGYAVTGIEEDALIIQAMLSLHGLFF